MRNLITISWNPNTDETTITQSKEFLVLYDVAQLDVLQDSLGLITDLYNQTLKEQGEEYERKRKNRSPKTL